jgi:pimeloyl-ACP methyl ester carboxylesterase
MAVVEGPFRVDRGGGVVLDGESAGEGPEVLLLHGLTATRRYVLHGSRALERAGRRVIAYDARGHGRSTPPADPADYAYRPVLADDAVAVLDAAGAPSAVLMGQSMGSATALAVAFTHPARVRALVIVTPAHRGHPATDLTRWDGLSRGLATGGVEGFMSAIGEPRVPEKWRASITTVVRQRMERHEHPDGVAAALAAIPRTAAFDGLDALRTLTVPTLVVGSRDELDPDHPLAVAEDYARLIPDAQLVVEDPGESPLAWRGGSLSNAVLDFLARRGV